MVCLMSSLRRTHELARHDPVEVSGEGAHVLGDGHFVVVQDDDDVALQVPRVVEGLERHAARERAVSDHRENPVFLVSLLLGLGEPRRDRDGVARVARIENVVDALPPAGKTAETSVLPYGAEAVLSFGDDLVGVALVAHVPDDPVVRRVENIMEGKGKLDYAEIRRRDGRRSSRSSG